jgi:diguanylate cyclase
LSIILWGLLLGAVQLAAGIAIGRCLPLGRSKPPSPDVPREQEETILDTPGLRGFASRLHELLASVAGDVDAHQTQLGLVNENLNSVSSEESAHPLTDAMLRLVSRITRINEQLQGRLKSSEEKLRDQADAIRHHLAEARTDPLTQLPNRRAFDDEIDRRIAEWNRNQTPCSLLMVDIDHFKAINDRHGHPFGDHALKAIADVLVDTLRKMEIVTRFGGEEFAIVLPATAEQGAMVATERIRRAVETLVIQTSEAAVDVTISSGLAVTCEGDDAASLLARADEALYASKENGRNCSHFHNCQTCELIEVQLDPSDAGPATVPPGQGIETNDEADQLGPDLAAACEELRHRLNDFTDPR